MLYRVINNSEGCVAAIVLLFVDYCLPHGEKSGITRSMQIFNNQTQLLVKPYKFAVEYVN